MPTEIVFGEEGAQGKTKDTHTHRQTGSSGRSFINLIFHSGIYIYENFQSDKLQKFLHKVIIILIFLSAPWYSRYLFSTQTRWQITYLLHRTCGTSLEVREVCASEAPPGLVMGACHQKRLPA